MAKAPQKDLLSRLADAGEDAIQRLADMPGANRVLDAVSGLRDRLDELQRRVRGIEQLEQRVAKLEKELAALKRGAAVKPKAAAARKTVSRKPAA